MIKVTILFVPMDTHDFFFRNFFFSHMSINWVFSPTLYNVILFIMLPCFLCLTRVRSWYFIIYLIKYSNLQVNASEKERSKFCRPKQKKNSFERCFASTFVVLIHPIYVLNMEKGCRFYIKKIKEWKKKKRNFYRTSSAFHFRNEYIFWYARQW